MQMLPICMHSLSFEFAQGQAYLSSVSCNYICLHAVFTFCFFVLFLETRSYRLAIVARKSKRQQKVKTDFNRGEKEWIISVRLKGFRDQMDS